MRDQDRRRVEVVDGNVEEALQLMLMEIQSQHAISSRCLDHVREQLGTDRHPRLILSVLPRVSVVRHDAGNSCRRRPTRGIDQEQELHDVLSRRVRRLDDEDVRAADIFIDSDEDLAIRESIDRQLGQFDSEGFGDFFGESPVGASRQELEAPEYTRQMVHYRSPET